MKLLFISEQSHLTVLKNIAGTGLVNEPFTFVALGAVDRAGRRPLMWPVAAGLAAIRMAG
jgi:hypothetical protein